MRFATFAIGLLAVLSPVAASWSKEDREIFRVRDELASALGPDVSFYDFVGVAPAASLDEINKAYRKRTRSLHPDKVKQQLAAERAAAAKTDPDGKPARRPTAAEVSAAVKRASDMQARLGIVTNILRGPERDRYDHFLAHGFPVWKGTGYYYNRYRPGIGTVLVGLFVFVGGAAHYLALYMGWKRQRAFMERYVRHARTAAWGDSFSVDLGATATAAATATGADVADDSAAAPQALNRKQRRMQERESKRESTAPATTSRRGRRAGVAAADSAHASGTATPAVPTGPGPQGAKRRVSGQNGKSLIVDSLGDVYLEEYDADGNLQELLLDLESVTAPTFRDTAVYRLPAWVYSLTVGRFVPGNAGAGTADQAGVVEDVDDDESSAGKATPSTDSNEEFEALGASTDSLGRAQVSGGNKASRRKGRK